MADKKYKITCCYDCPDLYDLQIKNCVYCNRLGKCIKNADIIDQDCTLEDY